LGWYGGGKFAAPVIFYGRMERDASTIKRYTMRLSIPKPCHENWNEMTPNEQGSFCNVCAKTVVDFSQMSDEEVLGYFKNKGEEKTCGRFKATQLAPYEFRVDIRKVARGSFPKIFAASMFIFFTSLFVCKSDTGQIMPVTVAIDDVDTAALRGAVIDTVTENGQVAFSIDTTVVNEGEMTGQQMINGGVQAEIIDYREQALTEDVILIGDTTYAIDTSTAVIESIKMGLIAVDHNPQRPPVCNKKPPKNDRYVKGKMIMGDIAY
jgi:hypothetical protein